MKRIFQIIGLVLGLLLISVGAGYAVKQNHRWHIRGSLNPCKGHNPKCHPRLPQTTTTTPTTTPPPTTAVSPQTTTTTPTTTPPPTTTVPPPTTTTTPPANGTLRPVDGGPNYYAQFANPLPTDPSFFPIATFLSPAENQAQMDAYKNFGINILDGVECPECTNEALLRANGIRTLIQSDERTRFNDIGSENAGYLLADELDMQCGPPCDGYTQLESIITGLPNDGRLHTDGFGKGVLFWESNQDAQHWLNGTSSFGEYQYTSSADKYWFTDPNCDAAPGVVDLSNCEHVAANYGWNIDRLRYLDGLDGVRQPIWAVVELGWPFTESAAQGGRRILPAELRAAVWQSIIAGARGIIYFDHNFGPNTPGSVIRDSAYPDTGAMATSVDAQIKSLAPVLNSPADPTPRGSAGIRTMTKVYNGTDYIFAGSSDGLGHNATITANGTTATVLGESRSIPITDGRFTDDFADGNAIHIYRID